MKNYIHLIAAALCVGTVWLVAPTSSAQTKAAKLEAIAQQLNLRRNKKAKFCRSSPTKDQKYRRLRIAIRSRACRRYSKLRPSIARLTRR